MKKHTPHLVVQVFSLSATLSNEYAPVLLHKLGLHN